MNLTRRQITVVVAALLHSQKEYRKDTEMHKTIDELIEMFDLEHQKIVAQDEETNDGT